MIKVSLKLLTLTPKAFSPMYKSIIGSNIITNKFNFLFSNEQNREHDKNCNHNHHDHQHHKDNHQEKQNQKTHQHDHNQKSTHEHVHGPNCSHGHEEVYKSDPKAKLSKLPFEELIEINTQDSIKYANLIYQQELKNKSSDQQQIKNLKKQIQFFRKVDEEINEKEQKLNQNIAGYEEELKSSKKRADKQIQESKSFAITKIAKQLLEVADCITQCKKLAADHIIGNEGDQYFKKITESHTHVHNILKKYDIEEFDPINTEYNPNTQQSLLQIPTPPDYKKNNVAVTMRTGYLIKGRLLRSARVGVFA